MYRITYIHKDSTTEHPLYIPGDQDYCLTDAQLSLEMGKAGELTVSIPYESPARYDIVCPTDEIIFYRNDVEIWRGRPVTIQGDFDMTGTLVCEGILAYLYDTYFEPFEFEGSPKELLTLIINNHNSHVESRKQFVVGDITVEDNNDYINRSSIYYDRTLSVMTEKLINDSLGGYFRVRVDGNTRYLDYLDTYDTQATQMVQYGENILDIATEVEYSDLATVILPLGARLEDESGVQTDEYLTIASVNGGSIYYEDPVAVSEYGWICVCVEWEDVTLPDNLLTKAKQYLTQVTSAVQSFTVNAVDLSLVYDDYDAIKLGDYVWVRSMVHGINQYIELTAMTIYPLAPENDQLQFGGDTATLTDAQRNSDRSIQTALGSLSMRVTNLTADVINAVYANIQTIIAETITTDYIRAAVADLGYVTADYLFANYIDASTIEAEYLRSDAAVITDLTAWAANVYTLLSGQAGVGELEAIYLTTANAVIDEAVIVDALMNNATIGTLLAGKIYTDYIQIMDNEDDQALYITGSVIQFRDADGVVRMQMGLDAEGYWNYYILDADGNTIFDALGLTEAGLVGNGAIIRNDAVADDAAISGYKLDIQSVTQYLNEYGGITLEAAQVTIDGERLDYRLDTITQMIGTGNTFTLEFYQSDSPTELVGGVWSTTQPQWEQGKYIWMREVTTYADGTVTTSEAVCITGNSGDGVGIEDIEAYYAAGDSGTVAPSGSSGTGELLTPPYYDGSGKTSNGVTYTVNSDGSVTTSGTSTGESTYYLAYDLPVYAGQCTLSGLPGSGSAYTYQYRYSLGGGSYEIVNYTPTSFNVSADTTITVWIRIANGISQSYTFTPSLTGTMDVWQTTQPDVGETGYLWMRYKITLTDGSIKWTEPCCLTDGYTRQQVTNLQTELSVVQGQITAKIWESDIETAIANLDLSTIRNYALLSGAYTADDDPSQILTWTSTSSTRTLTAEDGYIRVTTGTSTSTVFWRLSGEFAEGEKYTVSIRWRASSSVSPTLRAVYSYKNGSSGYYTVSLGSQSVGTDWTDTVVQWTATAYSSYDAYGIGFLTVANTDIDVAHIMVEQGETAHDWVRAPEDYATVSQITTITDQYTTLTMELGEIDALVGQMQTTMADDYLELSTKITNLQVTVDGLTFDTSDIYQYIDDTESVITERVTNVELTASGLTSTVTQISTAVDALGTDISSVETNLTSRIEQLAGSITLEVSGGLGSNASIVLNVDGSSIQQEIDLARVRQAFADDESTVFIEGGLVAFATNTFQVDADNLQITTDGKVITNRGSYETIMDGGYLEFYYDNSRACYMYSDGGNYLRINDIKRLWMGSADEDDWRLVGVENGTAAIGMMVASDNKGTIGVIDETTKSTGVWIIAKEVDNGTVYVNTSSSPTIVRGTNITLNTNTTITGSITVDGIESNNSIRYINSSGGVERYATLTGNSNGDMGLQSTNSSWILAWNQPDGTIYLGPSGNAWTIHLRGTAYLGNSELITSDRQLKDNITPFEPTRTDELTDKLEPKIYTLASDPETKHIGFIVDEVEDAMRAAGYDPDEYGLTDSYIDDDGNEMGAIRYDEFIPILLYEIQALRDRVKVLENPEEELIDPGIQLG